MWVYVYTHTYSLDAVLFSVVHYLLIKNVYILDTFNFQECMNLEKF